jgi:hypothetical protein
MEDSEVKREGTNDFSRAVLTAHEHSNYCFTRVCPKCGQWWTSRTIWRAQTRFVRKELRDMDEFDKADDDNLIVRQSMIEVREHCGVNGQMLTEGGEYDSFVDPGPMRRRMTFEEKIERDEAIAAITKRSKGWYLRGMHEV